MNIHSEVYDDKLYLLAFNNYLFYGKKSDFAYMQKDLYHIYELVQDFGYWDDINPAKRNVLLLQNEM